MYASHLLSGRPCQVSSGAISRSSFPLRLLSDGASNPSCIYLMLRHLLAGPLLVTLSGSTITKPVKPDVDVSERGSVLRSKFKREQVFPKPKVGGSSPLGTANKIRCFLALPPVGDGCVVSTVVTDCKKPELPPNQGALRHRPFPARDAMTGRRRLSSKGPPGSRSAAFAL